MADQFSPGPADIANMPRLMRAHECRRLSRPDDSAPVSQLHSRCTSDVLTAKLLQGEMKHDAGEETCEVPLPKAGVGVEMEAEAKGNVSELPSFGAVLRYRMLRSAQWEQLLAEHMHHAKIQSRPVMFNMPRVTRTNKIFPTGSQYCGQWDILGMSGKGRYVFPHGVIYDGEFFDGRFHGKGRLLYPCGVAICGVWERGQLQHSRLIFHDGLEYKEQDWTYLTPQDRRFVVEMKEGLQPAGESFATNEQPPPAIPPRCYDTVDGFYRPDRKAVFDPVDKTVLVRAPAKEECHWIESNCRKEWDEVAGPRPDLYGTWLPPCPESPPPPTPPGPPATKSDAEKKVDVNIKAKAFVAIENLLAEEDSKAAEHLDGIVCEIVINWILVYACLYILVLNN